VITSRLLYRFRQFQKAFSGPGKAVATKSLQPYLNPSQIVLFSRMHPSEQAHALDVLEQLQAAGHDEPELLTAALLHDVGKILSPLSSCERVLIVVGQRFFPRLAKRLSQGAPRGLRHAFVVAERHAGWSADLAAQSGASARTVDLISRHQDPLSGPPRSRTERLLAALQSADDST
jgi:predicted HD phosphohydrolase